MMFIINLLAAVSAAASPLLVWAAVKFFESGLADNGTQTLGLALLCGAVPVLVRAFKKAVASIYE